MSLIDNQRLINYLNQLLSNYFVMHVKLHRYHWYIKGSNFFQLHEHFETLYSMVQEDIDEIAERILAIGGKPLATMSMYLKMATLIEANADDTQEEIINQLHDDFRKITEEIETDGLPLANKYKDDPTNDLLTNKKAAFEKEIWKLQAFQNRDE